MKRVYITILTINVALAIAWYLYSLFLSQNSSPLLIAYAHSSLAALVFFPVALKRNLTIIDPLNLVILYTLIGFVAPAYFITFDRTPRIDYLMSDRTTEEFLDVSLMYLLSLLTLSFGYSICRTRIAIEGSLPRDDKLSENGFQFALITGMAMSVIGIFLYIQSTGGISFDINDLSKKRAIEVISDGEIVYANGAYLRMLSDISVIMLLIVLSYYIRRYQNIPIFIKLQLWTLGILSVIVPFVSSSRSAVVFVLLGVLMVLSTHNRLNRRNIIVGVAATLLFFGSMTALRGAAQKGEQKSFTSPFMAMAESGNGLSIFGTTHIIKGVPERMPYQYGSTYITWVYAPIPRTLWHDKPDISLGKRVKEEIMNLPVIRSGRPPSIINEGWINFGFAGFMFNAFAYGFFLRLIGNSLKPILSINAFSAPLLYTLTLNSAALTNSALSQGVVRILTDLVLIFACFILIKYSIARKKRVKNIVN